MVRWKRSLGASLALVCVGLMLSAGTALAGPAQGGAAPSRPAAGASVVGGSATTIEQFPWLVYIQAEEGPEAFYACTGTVVAPRVVLTAGHCVATESGPLIPPSRVKVGVGVADLRQAHAANAVYSVTKTLMFPEYDPSVIHGDAGLMILSRPVAAPAISLATNADAALYGEGDPIAIAGWGLRSASDKGSSELQSAVTTVQSTDYCRRNVVKYYPFYSPGTQTCAIDSPGHEIGTCHGDSGGPAIAIRPDGTPVEIGITSLGNPKCSTNTPDIFTRVDTVSTWVSRWIAAVETGAPAPREAFPHVAVPSLDRPTAERLLATGLKEHLKFRFAAARHRRLGCDRVSKSRIHCEVRWEQGVDDYYGSATVYLVQSKGAIYWELSYRIHFVDEQCLSRSSHPRTCLVRTLRG
jgi:secreted trypsin-like serine protease